MIFRELVKAVKILTYTHYSRRHLGLLGVSSISASMEYDG